MDIQFECRDTWNKRPDYTWSVCRWCSAPMTARQAVRLAKKLSGMTGVMCRKEAEGDMTRLVSPSGQYEVLVYPVGEQEEGEQVDARGNIVSSVPVAVPYRPCRALSSETC